MYMMLFCVASHMGKIRGLHRQSILYIVCYSYTPTSHDIKTNDDVKHTAHLLTMQWFAENPPVLAQLKKIMRPCTLQKLVQGA